MPTLLIRMLAITLTLLTQTSDMDDQLLTEMAKRDVAEQQQAKPVDPAVARAMALLLDDEKPSLPIEVIDPDPLKFPIFRIRPKTEGITDGTKHEIFLNRQSPAFSDDLLLASVLAHEQEHARRIGQPDQYDEGPAWKKQYEVLKRLKYKDNAYMNALYKQVQSKVQGDPKR